jgi:hypothetical protein
MKRMPVFLMCLIMALSAGACGSSSKLSRTAAASRPGSATSIGHATRKPVPAWAQKCLPRGRERIGSAPSYLGLTPAAAERRSGHDGDSLVYAGGGKQCSHFDDQVARSYPIAVVYNTRFIRNPRARIIAAVRAAPGWEP